MISPRTQDNLTPSLPARGQLTISGLVQPPLSFGAVHNVGLISSHWLENRLKREPEWAELREKAREVLDKLADLWTVQSNRVERYGDEQGLEEGFIQPVLRELGWKLKYQTRLQVREPDYALFLDDAGLEAALAAGRHSDDFWTPVKVVADAKAWHVRLDLPTKAENKREYPPEQIEWYLDRSRLDWGVLTNGKSGRLVPRQLARIIRCRHRQRLAEEHKAMDHHNLCRWIVTDQRKQSARRCPACGRR